MKNKGFIAACFICLVGFIVAYDSVGSMAIADRVTTTEVMTLRGATMTINRPLRIAEQLAANAVAASVPMTRLAFEVGKKGKLVREITGYESPVLGPGCEIPENCTVNLEGMTLTIEWTPSSAVQNQVLTIEILSNYKPTVDWTGSAWGQRATKTFVLVGIPQSVDPFSNISGDILMDPA